YLQEFADFWATLPTRERCEIVHQPMPEEPAPPAAPTPLPWWARAAGWMVVRFRSLKGEGGA
ncbi:MAG: hypothetical protein ACK46X_21650, partial [Candidatus Sericytochromatia bacterium]